MSNDSHERLQRDLGVYVLGRLQPFERDRFERHLSDCRPCRDEVARLGVLPSFLDRLRHHADDGGDSPHLFEPALERLALDRRRQRRHDRIVGAAAALVIAAATATVVVALMLSAAGSRARVYLDDGSEVTATIAERPWGMAVRIHADELPLRQGYVALAVARDGHREHIASWRPTNGAVDLEGACYLFPDDVIRVEITTEPESDVLRVLHPA